MGVHRTRVKHIRKIIFTLFLTPALPPISRPCPAKASTRCCRPAPHLRQTPPLAPICSALKTKDRHHTTSFTQCQAGRRKISANFVPGGFADLADGVPGGFRTRLLARNRDYSLPASPRPGSNCPGHPARGYPNLPVVAPWQRRRRARMKSPTRTYGRRDTNPRLPSSSRVDSHAPARSCDCLHGLGRTGRTCRRH